MGKPSGAKAPSGSEHTRKQIAYTVLNGQQITFFVGDGREIDGYVYGMDDYHWSVVSDDGQQYGVHKSSSFRIHKAHTFDDIPEDQRKSLEALVLPFRGWVAENVLNRAPANQP